MRLFMHVKVMIMQEFSSKYAKNVIDEALVQIDITTARLSLDTASLEYTPKNYERTDKKSRALDA